MRFLMVVAAAGLGFGLAAICYAQDKDAPHKAPAPARVSEQPKEDGKANPEPKPVIEITRSAKVNCDVKPVMTDDEIAQCKKAWRK